MTRWGWRRARSGSRRGHDSAQDALEQRGALVAHPDPSRRRRPSCLAVPRSRSKVIDLLAPAAATMCQTAGSVSLAIRGCSSDRAADPYAPWRVADRPAEPDKQVSEFSNGHTALTRSRSKASRSRVSRRGECEVSARSRRQRRTTRATVLRPRLCSKSAKSRSVTSARELAGIASASRAGRPIGVDAVTATSPGSRSFSTPALPEFPSQGWAGAVDAEPVMAWL